MKLEISIFEKMSGHFNPLSGPDVGDLKLMTIFILMTKYWAWWHFQLVTEVIKSVAKIVKLVSWNFVTNIDVAEILTQLSSFLIGLIKK